MALLSRPPVEARRIGATLVATFHRANPPLIWRFDLDRNHSFTLALQGEEGEWELGLTSIKGEFYPVARFAEHEDAEASFTLIGDIMATADRPWWGSVFKGIGLAFTMLLVVMIGFGIMVGRDVIKGLHPGTPVAETRIGPADSASPTAPAAIKSGVPQAADDVLTPP